MVLAGLLPGVLLGAPAQLQAGRQKVKPFLHQLEMEHMAKLKPEKSLPVTCENEKNGMTVLYMPEKAEPLFALNRTGKTVWDACNGENTLKDIATTLSQKYEVTREQASFDVYFTLLDLRRKGVVWF